MKGSAKMIPSNSDQALSGAFPSKSAVVRRRIGIHIFLLALPAGALRAQVPEAPPKPAFADNAPVISHESLTKISLPHTTIDSVELNASDGSCRVRATVTHSPTGCRVKVFVAMPTKGWNGRFQGTGGGGFAGGNPGALSGPLRLGFATAATDTGHAGGSGSFALGADGRLDWHAVQDNAYLGIHEMTVVGKALTKAFYGKAPRYSYFVGGSTGGRQGLMEAQRYPEDYDGIISACPAINWHRFLPADIWPQVVMAARGNFVPKAKLDAATAAAVASGDASDGVTDGVLDDPSCCTYDPKNLVGTKVGDSTFTEADADVVRTIWEGPRGRNGEFLWYGLARGADLSALSATGGSPLTGRPFSIPLEWCRFFLLQDPKWDWTTLTPAGFEVLWKQSVEEFGAVIGTDDPDLIRFRDRGGKIIILHGLTDQLIPAEGTIDYYKRVLHRMGGREEVWRFARLFLAPGVDHGFRGPGATPVGRMEAIIRWVEEGTPPDKLMAEHRDGSGKVTRTRPLFPYPQVAKYRGSGSTDNAENFVSSSPAN
jgi:feruloyl esterase